MEQNTYLQVRAANGVLVRTTRAYWEKIVTFKHPVMQGREEAVKEALQQPDEIRQSTRDPDVLLYYRRADIYHTCVVVRVLSGEGFIVTAYITDRIKEGRAIWRS